MTLESSCSAPYDDSEVVISQRSEQDTLDAAYLRVIASQLCFNADMQPVQQVIRTPFIHRTESAECTVAENPGGLALWITVKAINAAAAERHFSPDHNNKFQTSGEEWYADHRSGFQETVDLDFSTYFSACLANAVVEEYYLPKVPQAGLTLTDWASLIGQGWFAKLANTLAFGPPNIYTTLGLITPDYAPGAFKQALNDRLNLKLKSLFEVSQQTEPSEQGQLPPVTIVTALREELRRRRRGEHTCPGALKSVAISEELTKDPRVKLFIEEAGLKLQSTGDTAHSRYALASSAITQTLQAFSQALRSYDEQFGTPAVSLEALQRASRDRSPVVSHVKRKPLGLLAAYKPS